MSPPVTDRLHAAIIDAAAGHERILVGIAGPPGVGKSTLAADLAARLDTGGLSTAVVPMDGFHLDNATLRRCGLLARKGAPQTFDVDGFIALVERLKSADDPVSVPLFDREAEAVRENARTVSAACRIVLLEGNYLLLDRPPWTRVPALLDLSIFITASLEILEERLVRRWLEHGYNREEAQARATANDLRNARLVLEQSVPADLTDTVDGKKHESHRDERP